jgi:hypothetical protein
MALIPELDMRQLMTFVDQKRLKESVVRFLHKRKETRMHRVYAPSERCNSWLVDSII